jgi:preprotein translocase subunit SecA
MFKQMLAGIDEEAVEMIFRLQPVKPERFKGVFSSISQEFRHPEVAKVVMPEEPKEEKEPALVPPKTTHPKVGRNDPCPCGSGKKYKKCCGR